MELPAARALHSSEWPLLWELLRTAHDRTTLESYPAEYPLMFEPRQAPWLFVARAPGSPLLSHVGTFRRTMRLGALRLPVALVGSVATHPAARGQGLAGRTLEAAHAALREAGILLTLLWSEGRNLYRAAGYHPVGRSLLFRVEETALEPDPSLRCRPAQDKDLPAITALLEARPGALERTSAEHTRLVRIPGVEGYVAERDGHPAAVLYVGKGTDIRDIGHDFAGAAADVLRLALWTRHHRDGTLGLLTPGLPDQTARLALSCRWPSVELPVAQACVLEPEALVTLLASQLSAEELARLRGGLQPSGPDLPLEQRLFGPAPGAVYPSFYVWGLDSM